MNWPRLRESSGKQPWCRRGHFRILTLTQKLIRHTVAPRESRIHYETARQGAVVKLVKAPQTLLEANRGGAAVDMIRPESS